MALTNINVALFFRCGSTFITDLSLDLGPSRSHLELETALSRLLDLSRNLLVTRIHKMFLLFWQNTDRAPTLGASTANWNWTQRPTPARTSTFSAWWANSCMSPPAILQASLFGLSSLIDLWTIVYYFFFFVLHINSLVLTRFFFKRKFLIQL